MTESKSEITIQVPAREAVRAHIQRLQDVLTERNKQIENLEKRLREAEAGEPNQEALARSYQRGWMDATDEMVTHTDDLARELGRFRKKALDIYFQSDGEEFAPGECDGSGTCPAPVHVHGCYRPHRSDECDSPEEYGHTDRPDGSAR